MPKHKQRRKQRPAASCHAIAPKRATISLVMIVRDEEQTLRRCLDSVRGVVDELVIVDTGSTDATRAIAAEYGARVGEFEWCGDFGAARNYALSLARCEWAFQIDADEVLDPASRSQVRALANNAPSSVWAYSIPQVSPVEADGGFSDLIVYQRRLFRRLPNVVAYQRAIHEEVAYAGKRGLDGVAPTERMRLLHEGYRDREATERKTRTRNLPIVVRAHQHDPENYYYLLQLCLFAAQAGEVDAALAYHDQGYARMGAEERRTAQVLALTTHDLMSALLEARRPTEAWTVGKAVTLDMPAPELFVMLGRAALAMRNMEAAAQSFKMARDGSRYLGRFIAGATTSLPLSGLMSCALARHDAIAGLQAAAEALTFTKEREPQSDIGLRSALFLLWQGDQSSAASILHRFGFLADERAPTENAPAQLQAIVQGMAARDDHHGVVAALSDLIEVNDTAAHRYLRSQAYTALGWDEDAVADLKRAHELAPGDLATQVALAEAARRTDDAETAIASYRRVIAIDPPRGEAWLELGKLLYATGVIDEAAAAAGHAIELLTEKNGARRLLAECLSERFQLLEACEVLIDGLAETPEDKETRLLLVGVLEKAGARDQALAVLGQALEYDDQDAALYIQLGRMLAEQGRAEDAFNAYQVALALHPAVEVLDQALKATQRLLGESPVAPADQAAAGVPAITPAQPGAPIAPIRLGRAAAKDRDDGERRSA